MPSQGLAKVAMRIRAKKYNFSKQQNMGLS